MLNFPPPPQSYHTMGFAAPSLTQVGGDRPAVAGLGQREAAWGPTRRVGVWVLGQVGLRVVFSIVLFCFYFIVIFLFSLNCSMLSCSMLKLFHIIFFLFIYWQCSLLIMVFILQCSCLVLFLVINNFMICNVVNIRQGFRCQNIRLVLIKKVLIEIRIF